MEKTRSILLFILISIMLMTFFNIDVLANNAHQEIDIATNRKIVFSIDNVKPGDYISKSITVLNKGKMDFTYSFSNQFLNGSKKFYNKIRLKVSDNKGTVLYDGKIVDFKKIKPRFLANGKSERYKFMLKVPSDLGNDYQGLGCKFQLKFYVEGPANADNPVTSLPITGTNAFNFLFIGLNLILIGLFLHFYSFKK